MKHASTTISLVTILSLLAAGCTAPTEPTDPTATQGNGNTQNAGGTTTTAAANPYAIPSSSTQVYGSGATFPKPLLETWGIQFAKKHSKVQVSYAGGGSGKGINDITNKDVLFGGSDAPMTDAEKAKATTVLHIPETLGLVAVVYNVAEIPDGLMLTGEVVGKIYLGQIKKWNHDEIKALNPGVSLPDKDIAIVYRSDSSGTTFVFTDFLTRSSEAWKASMGATASKKPDWTKSSATQLSGNGNDGVGSQTKSTPNTIGYVEYAYVKSLGLKAAKIKNKAGEFVPPTTEGAKKAATAAAPTLPAPDGDWSDVSISHPEGAGVYPISSFSYLLVHKSVSDYGGKVTAAQMNAFRAWMYWALHDGQAYSETLGYAPLPAEVVTLSENALQTIQA